MVFGKKKKKKEEELPEAEEQEEGQNEYEDKIAELNAKIRALGKKADKVVESEKSMGEFSLNENEMALAVNALASSEEFKVYQQMVIGQQIAVIIQEYNKVIGGKKSEVSTDEEENPQLPT